MQLSNWAARQWMRMRASFWFTPSVVVLLSVAAAVGLVEADGWHSADLAGWSPRLFGAGADGSRAMLSAIATSMITVAGVVFSITMVTLSLTSTQYSPRVLRNFMRDGPTQLVLGVFVGIFAYCLVVLRTIRGGDEGAFIPSLSVLGGMAYAFAGIATLIFFIHHVAQSIQASSILARIARDTEAAIDQLFPQELGRPPAQEEDDGAGHPAQWRVLPALRSGYLTAVQADSMLAFACDTGRVVRLCLPVGSFVAEGGALLAVGGAQELSSAESSRLRGCVLVGSHRTVEQDAAFGLQQLVDVGLRALSPGINDPTTACMCLDQLGSLLARLARRHMPPAERFADGRLRVIAPAPDFGKLLVLALVPIVRNSGGSPEVLGRALAAVRAVATVASSPERRAPLRTVLAALRRELSLVRPRGQARELRRQVAALERELAASTAGPPPAQ